MGKLKYLVVHCTDTPPSMEVTREMIEQWHKGPRDLDGGGARYLGKTYRSRKDLPKDMIGGVNYLFARKRLGSPWVFSNDPEGRQAGRAYPL